jgi:hypothetical protein
MGWSVVLSSVRVGFAAAAVLVVVAGFSTGFRAASGAAAGVPSGDSFWGALSALASSVFLCFLLNVAMTVS